MGRVNGVMSRIVPVQAGGSEFMIEIAEPTGPADIEIIGLLDFDGMVKTLESIGGQLSAAWDVIKPSEMSVVWVGGVGRDRQADRSAGERWRKGHVDGFADVEVRSEVR
jgi:hypothetical protein